MQHRERRRFTRLPFYAAGHIIHNGTRYDFSLQDISLKGALIRLQEGAASSALPLDSRFTFVLELPASEADIEAGATAVHRDGPTVGLEFTMIDLDSITLLRRLLELNSGSPEHIKHELRLFGSEESD